MSARDRGDAQRRWTASTSPSTAGYPAGARLRPPDHAATFARELGLVEVLGRAGRVLQLGSAVTGLMVLRDVDFGVDAPGLTAHAAWETMRPLLGRCASLHYANGHEDRRHYFVMRIGGWKVDVSLWFAGMPPAVEAFQAELPARLTQESRLAILRLKDFWHRCRTIRRS